MKRTIIILLLPLVLTGCIGLAKSLEQLKNDPATVDLIVTTLYGGISLHRSVPTNFANASVSLVSTNR